MNMKPHMLILKMVKQEIALHVQENKLVKKPLKD